MKGAIEQTIAVETGDGMQFSKWRKKTHAVEPFVFIMLVSRSVFQAIQTNTVELQYCKVILNIKDEFVCLNRTASYFIDVQTFTSHFWITRSCTNLVIPCLCSFFLGPWSDAHGRKPLILFGALGYFLAYTLWACCSSLHLHPYYLLIFDLPLAVTGGKVMMVLAIYCYVCDITTMENRATRMSLVQAVLYAGHLIGTSAAPYLRHVSYTFAFCTCSVIMFFGLMYVYLFLEESVVISEVRKKSSSKNPFKLKQLKSLYESCFRKQPKPKVTILAFVILLLCLSLVQQYGEVSVFYLFLQNVLSWTLEDYTFLHSFSIVSSTVLVWGGTWLFSKYLKLPDMLCIGIVTIFRSLSALTLIFATDVWLIYLAKLFDSLSGMYASVIRVYVSRLFMTEDLGKVFALMGSLESFTPLIGSVVYNMIYDETIVTYPSGVFYVSGFLCATLTVIIVTIVCVDTHGEDDSAPKATKVTNVKI